MTVFEDIRSPRRRGGRLFATLGWVALSLFAVLTVWAALADIGPLPAADLPDWHGNVAASAPVPAGVAGK